MKKKMQMVSVKSGEFTMGSDLIGPIRGVKLDSFKIGKYPVTNKQYNEVMGNHKGLFSGENLPVERVNWFDAIEYCNKLSEMEGLKKCYSIKKIKDNKTKKGYIITGAKCDFGAEGYRLPTEAEWEYAAKGGQKATGFVYSGSNKADEVAWFVDNSDFKIHPVGEKKPNELKIYDMSGNGFEWCWDIFEYYNNETKTLDNPKGPSKKGFRVIKGGSFMKGSEYALVAARIGQPDIASHGYLGFRVVRKG